MAGSKLTPETEIYLVESYEFLDQIEADLINLEMSSDKRDLLEDLFRHIHTIKGNAGFLGFQTIELLCHKNESLLSKLKEKRGSIDSGTVDILLEYVDLARDLLRSVEETGKEKSLDLSSHFSRLEKLL
ncbi:MAG: hypothetical protein D6808_02750 [Candidatus Dadabacteria bacterium]|nr:MAG: hypothetical protein D6808_02750 [Candidatus Dadabacteria bacterium]